VRYLKHFGGKLTKERLTQCEQSPIWKKGAFRNWEHTTMDITLSKIPKLLYNQIFDKKGREPEQKLPISI